MVECVQLKNIIKDLIGKGKLSRFSHHDKIKPKKHSDNEEENEVLITYFIVKGTFNEWEILPILTSIKVKTM